MADKHDRLRHGRVAQHASMRRENSQQIPEALGPSGQAESSTYGARVSPHATSSSFSRRRRDSPSNATFPSSSRRRQVLPVPTPTIDVVDPVSPPESEVVVHAESEAFGRGPNDLSLLPLYPDHTAQHICDG
ncbi:unnamed protein product [Lathyrus oleraceus]